MDLPGWNQRLADHFGALVRDREDIPLFALEHGLAPAEILSLSNELHSHILVSPPSVEHALVWTVYAAEIGYEYAGDEFWQTFKTRTPGWTDSNSSRGWIRDAFVAFQKKFASAKPSGPWAGQFSIIAWPITHAILPRDLQQQLARILYELRHSFSAELFDEPQRLGNFIAARSWNTSARFQNLVQAPALVGQIAAALLLQGKEGFKALLHPMTLQRIGDDVDRERRGRDWLRGARRAAEERAMIRGLTIGRPTTTSFQCRDEARAEVVRLGIEPRLVLRPIEGSRWEVSLEIPDLSHLLLRFPQVRDVLIDSRCTVAGAAGRPLARGRCLHGQQRITLSRWPRPDEVLLQFERIEMQLEYLLRTECLLRPGTSWLFKVASDGLAYESRGMRVRADAKYLFVSTEPPPRSEIARHVELSCQGVHALLLDLPPALTPEWEQVLRQLQIAQSKSIEVWPAGLAAVVWDGEGHGEWLASETPTLAIRSDHPIDELTIAMGNGGASLSLTLTDMPTGEPIFIELPPLPVGLHKFSVAARSGSGTESAVIGDLDVVMRVREARPWSPGVTTHGPLEVEFEPISPSLEQLWDEGAAVVVRGPLGRRVKCRVQMFKRPGEDPLFELPLPSVTLPLSGEKWTRHFEFLKKDKSAQRAYDDSHVCELQFSADELGEFTLRCEREFKPLRWSLRKHATGFIARLHDDADSGVPVIERYPFERPIVREKLPQEAEHEVPRGGGLYVATLGDFKAALIAPPIAKEFADFQCEPQFESAQRTPETIARLLTFAQLWGKARLSGDFLAGMRRATVIRALTAYILALLCGRTWASAESKLKGELGLIELMRCISDKRFESELGSGLQADYGELADVPPSKRAVRLASLAESVRLMQPCTNQREDVGPDHSAWFAEFALRMASDPGTVFSWAGEHVDASIKKLLDVPTLARAARFLVLAVDLKKKSHVAAGEFYAGWGWSA
jgi:hypothetical protein